MLVKEAKTIVGGLSAPSKMPGHAMNTPADACKRGSELAKIPGSVCFGCYAKKGRYMFPNVQTALWRRLDALGNPQWVAAMTLLVSREKSGYFRWHDSGDLQSVAHLRQIVAVVENTPAIAHWLPTREYSMVKEYLALYGQFPPNLTVRVSAHMIDGKPPTGLGLPTSTVVSSGATCPAPEQGNQCRDCRACWDSPGNIAYAKH